MADAILRSIPIWNIAIHRVIVRSMSELEDVPWEVLYEMRVVARLQMGKPVEDSAEEQERLSEVIADEVEDYVETIRDRAEAAGSDDEAVFEPPCYLLDRLEEVCRSIARLERLRDRLITFARTYAVDPESSRVIAARTGLSHTTIRRTADEAAIREVADLAGPVAEGMLASLTPQKEPDLYSRLSQIVRESRQVARLELTDEVRS
jgi:hypothetical protein